MKKIEGGICAPSGFKAAGVRAGIKASSANKDCALLVSDTPCTVAGMFTTNMLKAPPIHWTEKICKSGCARAIFLSSGNANACTGKQGAIDAQQTAVLVGAGLDVAPESVCVLSTGVIGVSLPMDRITAGVDGCVGALAEDGGADAALAIMTTDTVPKEMAVEISLSSQHVSIGAMAKGSGMIAPNMATMFGILTTDAVIDADVLQPLLKECVDASFNQIAVDNDMSTSDAVVCLANGRSEADALTPGTGDYGQFSEGLQHVCIEMAKALVRDGEGATKFIEIVVEGAASDDDAKRIARSIAFSQLCKTAFFGEDANWGRIACAAGYSGAKFDPDAISIWISALLVVKGGVPTEFDEAQAATLMRAREIGVRVSVGIGPGSTTFWTSDLSYDYVKINADYRT